MTVAEHSLAILGVVLLVGLFIPAIFERFRVPFVSSLIIVGAVMGPQGLGIIEPNTTLTLFAFLGATFHMLLAGFESQNLELRLFDRDNALVFATNGLVPAAVGAGVGWYFDGTWEGSMLTASIFLSSSILLVFTYVRHFRLDEDVLGKRLKAAAVLQDLASTLLAFVVLKSVEPHMRFSLPVLLGLVLGSVATLRMFVPEVTAFAFSHFHKEGQAADEQRVRFILALMLVLLFLFSALDVPAVVAAFFVGFSMSSIEKAEPLRDRLHLIAYALFIPAFLLVVGLEIDISSIIELAPGNIAILVMVVLAIVSKVSTGVLAGHWLGMDRNQAMTMGLASSVKLAVPITTTYTALKLGVIGPSLFTAAVIVSVTTALLLPPLLELTLHKKGRHG
jgi:Kef-type K+ transport system membrane component KefB